MKKEYNYLIIRIDHLYRAGIINELSISDIRKASGKKEYRDFYMGILLKFNKETQFDMYNQLLNVKDPDSLILLLGMIFNKKEYHNCLIGHSNLKDFKDNYNKLVL